MKKSLITLSLFLSFCCVSIGQRVAISGKLKSTEDVAMPGVKVSALDKETITDDSGFFHLVSLLMMIPSPSLLLMKMAIR